MKAFIADVLLPERPAPAEPRVQYWAVMADDESPQSTRQKPPSRMAPKFC
jgi:hypothetical protein